MTKRPREIATAKASPLMVRLDAKSKQALTAAAELRRISVSDYVRTVTVAQARREVASARDQTKVLLDGRGASAGFYTLATGRSISPNCRAIRFGCF